MIKKLRGFAASYWRRFVVFLLITSALGGLFLPNLGSLVPGNSKFEQPSYLGVSVDAITKDISFAPIKAVQAVMVKIDDPNATLLRLVSVAAAIASVTAVYWVLARWHTRRIAVLATILFASSSYVLHLARFANQEVMYILVVPILILIGTWMKSKRGVNRLPIAALLVGVLLYVPGVLFVLIALAAAFRKRILLAWRFVSKKVRYSSASILFITILPIIYSLARYPEQIISWLGLNRLTEEGVLESLKQFLIVPQELVWTGPEDPSKWLVGTPVLDICTIVLAFLGAYSYRVGFHPLRARLLVGLLISGLFIIITSTYATVAILLPVFYILAASGIAYLLQSWFTVFPRNPIARSFGILLVCATIAVTVGYHLQRYYFAWPNSTETEQALAPPTNTVE